MEDSSDRGSIPLISTKKKKKRALGLSSFFWQAGIERWTIFCFNSKRNIVIVNDVVFVENRLVHQTFDFIAGGSV